MGTNGGGCEEVNRPIGVRKRGWGGRGINSVGGGNLKMDRVDDKPPGKRKGLIKMQVLESTVDNECYFL